MNKGMVLNTVFSSIGGALIGGAITFFVVKKHYEDYLVEEEQKIRRHYALIRKDEDTVEIFGRYEDGSEDGVDYTDEAPVVVSEGRAKAEAIVERLGYATMPVSEPSSEGARSIFERASDPSEVGPELTGPNGTPIETPPAPTEYNPRDPNNLMADYVRFSGEPYIIAVEEFFETEVDWDKESLSYYPEDDTLVDERQHRVEDPDKYVGNRHLLMFGVNSNDKNVVYVRNAQISTDFEIIRETGKASVVVFGEPDRGPA